MKRRQMYVVGISICAGIGAGLAMRALGYEYLTTGVASLTIVLVSCVSAYWLRPRMK